MKWKSPGYTITCTFVSCYVQTAIEKAKRYWCNSRKRLVAEEKCIWYGWNFINQRLLVINSFIEYLSAVQFFCMFF